MFYVVWDVETGNLIGDFSTKDEALSLVRELLADNTPDYVDALSLGCTDDDGETRLVAEGQQLASMARAGLDRPRQVI